MRQNIPPLAMAAITALVVTVSGSSIVAASTGWSERIKLKSDFRFRYDRQFYEIADTDKADRNRVRIRARLGLKMAINPRTDISVVLATGNDNPISTNQSLGGRFSTKGLGLDQAYATHRVYGDLLTVRAGKFKSPFAPTSWILFDPDLRFEGLAMRISPFSGGFINIGTFPLDELKNNEGDPWLHGAQAGLSRALSDSIQLTVAAGYYDLRHAQGVGADSQDGNTDTRFGIVNPTIKLAVNAPVTIGMQADYVRNIKVKIANTAWHLGLKFGTKKVKKAFDWQLFASVSEVGANAVFDELSDSDFHGGGTNNGGYTFGYKLGVDDNVQHALKVFVTHAARGPRDDETRVQADIKYRF